MKLSSEELRSIAWDLDELGRERAKGEKVAQSVKVTVGQPVMNYRINRMIRTASSCQRASEYLRATAEEQEARFDG
ncbi:flagellar biosynthesis/type III secretory pathway chaperone [Labrenzia sp. EL_126]|nr:flagellar biosynthesis/type III secretory pathway chaperone [Labrenzia sp. EL_126]